MAVSLVVAMGRRPVLAQPEAPGRDLLLDVTINGRPVGMIGEFQERAGALYAKAGELDALGIRLSNLAPDAAVKLAGVKGLSYRVDERTQTVFLAVAADLLKPVVLRAAGQPGYAGPAQSGFGAVANYDIVGTSVGRAGVVEGLLDTRVFSEWGLAANSFIGTGGAAYGVRPFTRLDSTYVFSDEERLRSYRGGDVVTGGLAWSRPIRIGGVQASSDFAIRPDLVTFPVPTIAGQVAVPSSIDVLVNGVQTLSRDVPPGPFEIRQLPVVTGTGDVSVTIRNSTGQSVTQTLPFYVSNLLLAPGLDALSAEAGAVRLNYGVSSNDYRAPAGSFTYRRGVADWLTLQTHAEANQGGRAYQGITAPGGGLVGGGAAFVMGRLGVVALDGAVSRYGVASGGLLSASFERITPGFSLAASVRLAGGGFNDVAGAFGEPFPRLQTQASAGLPLGRQGTIGVAYAGIERRQAAVVQPGAGGGTIILDPASGLGILPLLPPQRVSLVSASYSRPVFDQRAYVYVMFYTSLGSASSSGFVAELSIPLGRRSSVGIGAGVGERQSYGGFHASQTANEVGDAGWQVLANAGQPGRQLASVQYKSPWGLVDAGFDRVAGQTAIRGSVQGAVTLADRSLFASNTIYDSFAVVDTGEPGIGVLQENRLVGRTDASGRLLVADLRSYDANRLAIDPADIPLDAQVERLSQIVRPRQHAGVVVKFPVRFNHGAILRMTDAAGRPVPVGSVAQLASPVAGARVPVGYDGEAFVTGLGRHNAVTVVQPGGRHCSVSFDYQPVRGRLPVIGPLVCRDLH